MDQRSSPSISDIGDEEPIDRFVINQARVKLRGRRRRIEIGLDKPSNVHRF